MAPNNSERKQRPEGSVVKVLLEVCTENGQVRSRKLVGLYSGKDIPDSLMRLSENLARLCVVPAIMHEFTLIEILKIGLASSTSKEFGVETEHESQVVLRVNREQAEGGLINLSYEVYEEEEGS